MPKRWSILYLLIFGLNVCFAQTFQPPAVPLITIDPYTSVWSFGSELTGSPTRHWTGKPNPIDGLIRVDGRTYRFMGAPTPVMKTIVPTAKTEPYEAVYVTENQQRIGIRKASRQRAGKQEMLLLVRKTEMTPC